MKTIWRIGLILLTCGLVLTGFYFYYKDDSEKLVSRGEAENIIINYGMKVRDISEEQVEIRKLERRSPTYMESNIILQYQDNVPETLWFADLIIYYEMMGPKKAVIWLDARTGKVVYKSFLTYFY